MKISTYQSADGNSIYEIDNETGEIVGELRRRELYLKPEEVPIIRDTTKKRRKKKHEFIRLYRINWRDIAMKKQLSITEAGVLILLTAFVDWESNYLVDPNTRQYLNEASLAKLLKCDRSNLRKQLNKLEEKGFIAIVKEGGGKANKYILNTNIAICGETIKNEDEYKRFEDVKYVPKSPVNYS